MHLNDSKVDVGTKRDRHENIGLYVPLGEQQRLAYVIEPHRGFLGIQTFAHILGDPRIQDIPLILETPSFEKPREVWGKEIQVLQRLAGIESHPNLSDTKEKELTDSVREVIKLVGGSAVKKSRTSKVTANRKKTDHHDSDEDGDEE